MLPTPKMSLSTQFPYNFFLTGLAAYSFIISSYSNDLDILFSVMRVER